MTPTTPTTEIPPTGPTPVESPTPPPDPPGLGPRTDAQWAAAVALLDKWIAEDEAGTYDHEDDGYDLLAQLDANRGPHQRKLFPPEMKGKSW